MAENGMGTTVATWNSIDFDIRGITGRSSEAEISETTLLSSATGWREYECNGTYQPGTITFSILHNSDTDVEDNILGVKSNLVLTFPLKGAESSGATWTCSAIGQTYSVDNAIGDKVEAQVTFKLSAKPATAAGS